MEKIRSCENCEYCGYVICPDKKECGDDYKLWKQPEFDPESELEYAAKEYAFDATNDPINKINYIAIVKSYSSFKYNLQSDKMKEMLYKCYCDAADFDNTNVDKYYYKFEEWYNDNIKTY